MYQPAYYSLRDLNDNTCNGSWSLHQQNNTFGEHCDLFLTRSAIDINEEYDKEQLRQTILKHDSVFRHQLYELHRLYKIQRDMMNEMRSKELNGHMIQARTSQFSRYSSGIPVADDNGRQYSSNLSVNHGRLSMSGADNIQCGFGSMEENIVKSNYGPTQNGLRLKGCETLESGCKKLRRRLFDLELPAEAYMDDEEEGRGVSEVSMVENYLCSRNHQGTCNRDGNLSIQTGVKSCCNDDVLSANLHNRHPHGLSNLKEPIKVMKAYPSATTDVLGSIICSKEEMERQFQSSNLNSGFKGLVKFSHDPGKGREAGVSLSNMHLETERRQKGWFAYNIEAGQSVGNGCSLSASSPREDFPTTSRSQHVKKKIFGVEICERNYGASVEDSHMLTQQPFVPLSNVVQSESSSFSSWRKLYSGFSQDMTTVQRSFTQSNKSSVTLIENPEVIADKVLVSSNSQSIPSINAEASSQNHPGSSSQLKSKESVVWYSSNGFGHLNGITDGSSASEQFAQDGPKQNCWDVGSMMDRKSTEQKKADENVSADGTSKQSPHGGLSWLKVVPSCNGYSSEESQGSSQLNLHSLQNSFKQFVDNTETMRKSSIQSYVQDSLSATCALDADHRRNETGEYSSNKKILGFSISEKPCMSKELASSSTHSKQSCIALADDNTDPLKVGLPNTTTCDAVLPRFGEQQKVESRNDKELINQSADSRHCIDLNLSFVDEEAQPTFSSSRTNLKNSIEIDLEAPAKVEAELDLPLGCETSQSKLDGPPESFQNNSKYPDAPPGYESIQSNSKCPDVPSGYESVRSDSKYPDVPPGYESVRSDSKYPDVPPGYESVRSDSKYPDVPPGYESVRSDSKYPDVPPGYESVRSDSKYPDVPPVYESVRSNSKYPDVPPGYESVRSDSKNPDVPPVYEYVRSNSKYPEVPPGYESVRSDSKYPVVPPGFESFQSEVREPLDLLQDESAKLHEGLMRDAAEALVAISSSCMPLLVDTCCHQSTSFPRDPLHWFVEVISSYKSAIENEFGSVSMGQDSVQHDDIVPDVMDYFEYMTLNLTETKVEECCYKPLVFENPNPENILPKRPRRGHARRGRQRKDFQRDVLPTLTSLLKNEVTEDLQTIEGLIQATGGTWKSSLALRSTARNGPGRRKRRLATSEVCPPVTQLPECREVALEDGNLTGWGKRTRRPPRQRCLITSPPLAIK